MLLKQDKIAPIIYTHIYIYIYHIPKCIDIPNDLKVRRDFINRFRNYLNLWLDDFRLDFDSFLVWGISYIPGHEMRKFANLLLFPGNHFFKYLY